jgi:exosome complex RNA-binding protein Rrp42 (RNase PH superfamily)
VSINVGSIKTAEGSAIVKIGNTVVVCGIKAVSGVFTLRSVDRAASRYNSSK